MREYLDIETIMQRTYIGLNLELQKEMFVEFPSLEQGLTLPLDVGYSKIHIDVDSQLVTDTTQNIVNSVSLDKLSKCWRL